MLHTCLLSQEKDLLAATMAAASAAAALGLQPSAVANKVPDVTITSKAKAAKQHSSAGVPGV